MILLYTTLANQKDAEKLAEEMVKSKLVACANIYSGITSFYEYKGEFHKEPEVIVMMKTRQEFAEKAAKKIETLHPYETPCIVQLPIDVLHPGYAKWLHDQTKAN